MLYNTIHHELRNKENLSLLDWCLLESIYLLSNSPKSKYKNWCYASKASFHYLASSRTIVNRLNHLEAEKWIEFKCEKRLLKRTTKKYFNEIYSYVLGVKKLHAGGEKVAQAGVQKLHGGGEKVAPNNNIDNNIDNNINKERVKEKNTHKEIELNSEILKLKKQLQQQKQPRQISDSLSSSLNYFKKVIKEDSKRQISDSFSTSLDITLHNFKFSDEFSAGLQESILSYWNYLQEKKGPKWGSVTTIKAQLQRFQKLIKEFSDIQIKESIEECIERGNITFNPQWTINRIKKTQQNEKRTNNSTAGEKSLNEHFDDYLQSGESATANFFNNVKWEDC